MPSLSVLTWMGHRRADRRVPISNLFNHTPTPTTEGWSVRRTQIRDFRGKRRTYDSHNGTDFVVPVGTVVCAAAPGKVLRVSNEFHRGGLKIFMDHGRGLVTTSNHLARALVSVGDMVMRGQPIALSGYSGLDGVAVFPWSPPHVHFNVWLNGEYVDPFSAGSEPSLWREHNDPKPVDPRGFEREEWEPSRWRDTGVNESIAACEVSEVREELLAIQDLEERAMSVLFYRNYFPLMFRATPELYSTRYEREPWLSLPFDPGDFDGVVIADEARAMAQAER